MHTLAVIPGKTLQRIKDQTELANTSHSIKTKILTLEQILKKRIKKIKNPKHEIYQNPLSTYNLLITGSNPYMTPQDEQKFSDYESIVLKKDTPIAQKIIKNNQINITPNQYQEILESGQGILLPQKFHELSGQRISILDEDINLIVFDYLVKNKETIQKYMDIAQKIKENHNPLQTPFDRSNIPGKVYSIGLSSLDQTHPGGLIAMPLDSIRESKIGIKKYLPKNPITHNVLIKIIT